MTPRDDDTTADASGSTGPEHAARRTWTMPRRIGRFRTSTILLVLAFLATVLLRGYFISQEPQTEGTAVTPAPTTTESVPEPTTRPPVTTTTTPTPTPTPSETTTDGTGGEGTTVTPTTTPLIVLPPGIVPSGVELPPGVVVEETTTAPTSEPATTTP